MCEERYARAYYVRRCIVVVVRWGRSRAMLESVHEFCLETTHVQGNMNTALQLWVRKGRSWIDMLEVVTVRYVRS
jgi:hypothetical protein